MKAKNAPSCPKHPDVARALFANFCVFCGKRLHNHPVCPQCGVKLDVRGEFCQNCGCPRKTTEEILKKAFEEDGATDVKLGLAKIKDRHP